MSNCHITSREVAMKKTTAILIFLLAFASFLYVETLPSSVTSVFSSQVGVEFTAFPPPGSISFFSEYPEAKFVDSNKAEIGERILVLVDDAAKLTNLVSNQNFSCEEDDVVMVRFESQIETTMTLAMPDEQLMTVTFIFNEKTQEWELK